MIWTLFGHASLHFAGAFVTADVTNYTLFAIKVHVYLRVYVFFFLLAGVEPYILFFFLHNVMPFKICIQLRGGIF